MGYMVLRILGLTINCPPVLLFVVDRILIVLHYSVPGANPIVANVSVCDWRGIGGLGNEANRNAKTDQLRPVPRHKTF